VFGELSQLFGRNFVIGYFLPAALGLAAIVALLVGFGWQPSDTGVVAFLLPPNTEANSTGNAVIDTVAPLVTTTVSVLVVWFFAVILLALNRVSYRIMEGYGALNPARLLAWSERRRFDKLQKKKELAQDPSKKVRLERELAAQFPPEREQLLPTRFGNALRAFEYYSWWIYGIDAVSSWNRLVAVVPKDYQDLVSEAKAETDFWLHLWIAGLVILIGDICGVVYVAIFVGIGKHLLMLVLLAPVLLLTLVFANRARVAAIAWGDTVKAAFDVFLPELGKKLGFPPIVTRKQEKDLWWLFAKVITYRDGQARREFVEKLSASTDLTAMVQDELRSQLESRRSEIEALREPSGAPESPGPGDTADTATRPAGGPQGADMRPQEKRSLWTRLFGG
jgi:hypothetical protein